MNLLVPIYRNYIYYFLPYVKLNGKCNLIYKKKNDLFKIRNFKMPQVNNEIN